MDLYSRTMFLLDTSDLTIEQIAAGAGVQSRWLRMVKNGQIQNPGIRGIQRLYWFLEDQKPAKKRKANV